MAKLPGEMRVIGDDITDKDASKLCYLFRVEPRFWSEQSAVCCKALSAEPSFRVFPCSHEGDRDEFR